MAKKKDHSDLLSPTDSDALLDLIRQNNPSGDKLDLPDYFIPDVIIKRPKLQYGPTVDDQGVERDPPITDALLEEIFLDAASGCDEKVIATTTLHVSDDYWEILKAKYPVLGDTITAGRRFQEKHAARIVISRLNDPFTKGREQLAMHVLKARSSWSQASIKKAEQVAQGAPAPLQNVDTEDLKKLLKAAEKEEAKQEVNPSSSSSTPPSEDPSPTTRT